MTRPQQLLGGLGLTMLAAVFVSTLPGDLPFLLPAFALLAIGLFAALRRPGSGPHLPRWLAGFCWLWLLLLALNPFISAWIELSIWTAIVYALMPVCILALPCLLAEDAFWDRLEWLLFAVTTFVALCLLVQYFFFGERADGPFLDANVAAAVVYSGLLPLLYRLFTARDGSRLRGLLWGLAFVLALGLFTTLSRGSVGSFVIALAATVLVVLVRGTRAMRLRLAGIVVLVVVAFALVTATAPQKSDRYLRQPSQDNSLQTRFRMWHSALQIFTDAPVTGHGLGSFTVTYPRYRSMQDTATSGHRAHSDYLQMLAEGGVLLTVPLLLFVLGLCGGALWLLLRLWRTPQGAARTAQLRDLGLFATLLALATHAIVNFIFSVLILALFCGLYAARLAGRYTLRTHSAAVESRGRAVLCRLARPLTGLALLIALVSIATGWFMHQLLGDNPSAELTHVSLHDASYRRALPVTFINPVDYRSRAHVAWYEANVAIGYEDRDKGTAVAITALRDLDRLLRIKHPDCMAQTLKSKVLSEFSDRRNLLQQSGVWQQPAAVLERAIAADPMCMSAYVARAELWQDDGDPARAITTLLRAVPWLKMRTVSPQNHALLLTKLAELRARTGNRERAYEILDEVDVGAPNYQPAQELRAQIDNNEL